MVFRDVKPCDLVNECQGLKGIYCFFFSRVELEAVAYSEALIIIYKYTRIPLLQDRNLDIVSTNSSPDTHKSVFFFPLFVKCRFTDPCMFDRTARPKHYSWAPSTAA